jgi:hypothetical protein
MKKENTFKVTIIVGLIVTAISAFLFTPLSDMIYKKNNPFNIIIEKDNNKNYENNEHNNLSENMNNNVVEKKEVSNMGDNHPKQNEDFDSFINKSIVNSNDNSSVSVTILDESGNISTSLSNSIASIYNMTGIRGCEKFCVNGDCI